MVAKAARASLICSLGKLVLQCHSAVCAPSIHHGGVLHWKSTALANRRNRISGAHVDPLSRRSKLRCVIGTHIRIPSSSSGEVIRPGSRSSKSSWFSPQNFQLSILHIQPTFHGHIIQLVRHDLSGFHEKIASAIFHPFASELN